MRRCSGSSLRKRKGEREALLLQAVTDVAGVQERLAQLYLKEILQYARKLWRQGIYIGDLIQEGNMSLLLALAEEMPEEGKADWMEERLLAGMESWVKEQTEQKYRDESMVEKVRKLEAAIRELRMMRNRSSAWRNWRLIWIWMRKRSGLCWG